MGNKLLFAIVSGGLLILVLIFVIALLLVKLLWSWTIPDLFPGAVQQGLVTESISWLTAFKIAISLTVLAGVAGIRGRRK